MKDNMQLKPIKHASGLSLQTALGSDRWEFGERERYIDYHHSSTQKKERNQ